MRRALSAATAAEKPDLTRLALPHHPGEFPAPKPPSKLPTAGLAEHRVVRQAEVTQKMNTWLPPMA